MPLPASSVDSERNTETKNENEHKITEEGGLWFTLPKRGRVFKYNRPRPFSIRCLIQARFYLVDIEDEDLIMEVTHFKIMRRNNII